MSADRKSVYLIAADKSLMRVRVADGAVREKRKFPHEFRRGITVFEGSLCVVAQATQQIANNRVKRWDILMALDGKTFETQWVFSDRGTFRGAGRMSTGAHNLHVAGSSGKVYQFQ